MSKFRIIGRLDIKGPNLVKGIHLEGLRVLGSPFAFAESYYEQGIDELLYIDVVASLYNRNSLTDHVARVAEKIFIPLAVGGGIRSIEDIVQILRTGADKVSINTAAVKDPYLIQRASQKFGSSTITVSIECIRQSNGNYGVFIDNGREDTGLDAIAWAKKVESLGAGEIIVSSVDREGTAEGFDLELTRQILEVVKIPVIAHGGAGNTGDIVKAYRLGCSGVAVASVLHYGLIHQLQSQEKNSFSEGNTRFINENLVFKKIKPISVKEIKDELLAQKIPTRIFV